MSSKSDALPAGGPRRQAKPDLARRIGDLSIAAQIYMADISSDEWLECAFNHLLSSLEQVIEQQGK